MKNGTKKAITYSGVALAAAAAASAATYLTTKLLSREAMDREEPKVFQKAGNRISGSKSGGTYREEQGKAAQKLAQGEHERVKITSHDGVALVGHWIPCENPQRVIIAMHGWRSSWYKDFGLIAPFWQAQGCSVLYAEQRGQGDSGGDFIGLGPVERDDCLDWIRWVGERCGADMPVYLCGVSMGATTVLLAAGLDLPANVHGIMADCGFTSPHAIWKHIANRNLHIPFRLRGYLADSLYQRKTQRDAVEASTLDALGRCQVPVMLVHGTQDRFVPVEMTYENYTACAAPKKLLIVPGAGHCMSYFLDREAYESAALDFWRQHD